MKRREDWALRNFTNWRYHRGQEHPQMQGHKESLVSEAKNSPPERESCPVLPRGKVRSGWSRLCISNKKVIGDVEGARSNCCIGRGGSDDSDWGPLILEACVWQGRDGQGRGRKAGERGNAAGVSDGRPRWDGTRRLWSRPHAIVRGDWGFHLKMEQPQAAFCLCPDSLGMAPWIPAGPKC